MFLFSMSDATCLPGTASGRCGWYRVNIGGDNEILATNDADDAVVGDKEKRRRHDVMADKHDERVSAIHCRSRPYKCQTLTVDHFRCRPGWDEETANTVKPRQDDSCIRHPTTVVAPVDDRVNYLHVALESA